MQHTIYRLQILPRVVEILLVTYFTLLQTLQFDVHLSELCSLVIELLISKDQLVVFLFHLLVLGFFRRDIRVHVGDPLCQLVSMGLFLG